MPPAASQSIGPERAIERLFREPIDKDWFADSFLAQVPAARVEAITTGFKERFGALKSVVRHGGNYVARLERADVPIHISLDPAGRIVGLLAETPVPTGGTLDDFASAIEALPGRTALLVVSDGKTLVAQQADAPLAVGSAMKLAILAALDDAVKQGRLGWDQVVRLDAKWRTLPSSTLIKWPLQTPITIASLANFMISISDNMATDALIDIVGRAPIEAITPRNSPFLTTSEMFKLSANADILAAWAHADAAAKRALLERIDRLPLPDAGQLTHSTGTAEWFLSAREICALLDRVAALPAMSINPGLADPDDWTSVAYKGGSDQGVLNFSTRLVSRDGKVHCVVASWNDDKDVPMDKLAAPYRGILHKLAAPE